MLCLLSSTLSCRSKRRSKLLICYIKHSRSYNRSLRTRTASDQCRKTVDLSLDDVLLLAILTRKATISEHTTPFLLRKRKICQKSHHTHDASDKREKDEEVNQIHLFQSRILNIMRRKNLNDNGLECLACRQYRLDFILLAGFLLIASVYVFSSSSTSAFSREVSRLTSFGTSTSTTKDREVLIGEVLTPWKEGYLEFHHIHAGVSVSTIAIFPDGTTLLTDAGDQDMVDFVQRVNQEHTGWYGSLRSAEPWPDPSLRPSQQIVSYVQAVWPFPSERDDDTTFPENDKHQRPFRLDYLVNTHFHTDHLGEPYKGTRQQPNGKHGDYILTGIPEVGDHFRVDLILDRNYPHYDFPYDLLSPPTTPSSSSSSSSFQPSKALQNYVQFVRQRVASGESQAAQFQVGSHSQIVLRNQADAYPSFRVRNIKCGLDVSAATSQNNTVYRIPGTLWPNASTTPIGPYDENELSTAYVVEYGKFRYYEGGDQEYHPKADYARGIPADHLDLDTVTPTAVAAGRVHVATLNHHGHGILPAFGRVVDPQVAILQGWCSDHMPEHALRVLMEERKRDLFATQIFHTRLQELGPEWASYFKSVLGTIVVRVSPPGPDQAYWVYILDGSRRVTAIHGPYDVD